MTKVLEVLASPFIAYWNYLERLFFFWRPMVLKWVFTWFLIFSVSKGFFYLLDGNPVMTVSLFGLSVPLPALPGHMPILWMFIVTALLVIAFIWAFSALPKPQIIEVEDEETGKKRKSMRVVVTKQFPATQLVVATIAIVWLVSLGWVAWV